jgi:hypothetical protein
VPAHERLASGGDRLPEIDWLRGGAALAATALYLGVELPLWRRLRARG